VLAPGGLLVMSTPERQAYSDARDFRNPFHARELTQAEFTELLGRHFPTVALFAQRAITGSRIDAVGDAGWEHVSLAIERAGDSWREAGVPEPLYLLAVACDGDLPPLPGESTLVDYGLEVLAERQRTLDEHVRRLDERQAELVATAERARLAEEEARRVKESVSWRALERVREVIGEDSFLGRHLRALLDRIFRASR
jgi:hypothetical protein